MATQKYWMRSDAGDFASVDGAAERDRWSLLGWSQADEPADGEQVWMRADGIELPARYPWGAREFWASRGWAPSAPPEPIDYTRDPRVADVAETPPSKPATAGKTEKKES